MSRSLIFIFMLNLSSIAITSAAEVGPVTATVAAGLSSCARLLTPSDELISTLKDLYNYHILSSDDLRAVSRGQNPLRQKPNSQSGVYAGTIDLVISELQNKPAAISKLDEFISSTESAVQDQELKREQTKNILLPIMFNTIRPGRFMMGATIDNDDGNDQPLHEVRLTKGFRLANVPVTQWQYAMVTCENPSYFKTGEGAVQMDIDGKKIRMRPNNPVEHLRDFETQAFLTTLNEWSKADDERIYKIMPNHKQFARLRLPTEAEWEYVYRNLGESSAPYPAGINFDNINMYAWTAENSRRMTHPVTELRPLMVDGQEFYDLIGNVWERVSDSHNRTFGLSKTQLQCVTRDPNFISESCLDVARGHGYSGQVAFHSTGERRPHNAGAPYCDVGLRLAEDVR